MAAVMAAGISDTSTDKQRPTKRRRRDVHQATERALETWIAQKRLLLSSEEGFAPYSIIHKIRREREGAGEGRKFEQRFLEVYWGDGYLVQLVTSELPEIARMVLTCYYFFRGRWFVHVRDQAVSIGCSKDQYFDELRVAEATVETCLRIIPRLATLDDDRVARAAEMDRGHRLGP